MHSPCGMLLLRMAFTFSPSQTAFLCAAMMILPGIIGQDEDVGIELFQ